MENVKGVFFSVVAFVLMGIATIGILIALWNVFGGGYAQGDGARIAGYLLGNLLVKGLIFAFGLMAAYKAKSCFNSKSIDGTGQTAASFLDIAKK